MELMIVVAILLIVAAIEIPNLLLARIAANRGRRGQKFDAAMMHFEKILRLNQQKLRLAQEQAGLGVEARSIPREKQGAFWQVNFQPLRRQVLDLDARKGRLVGSLGSGT